MNYITEPEKQLPVCYEADVFVAGGSCTGVFAAVRAARMGAKVVLVERANCFGGTATAGLVNIWHSLKDTDYKNQVIAGLTGEMTERLEKSGSAILTDDPSTAIKFDPNRLKYELDKLVIEEKIKVYLHTICVGALCENDEIIAAIIENKDGRSAVKAKFYIDATGDGDLMKYLGVTSYRENTLQPPTPCFLWQGDLEGVDHRKLIAEHGSEFGLPDDFGWSEDVPGLPNITLRADFHVFGVDCSKADDLTYTEIEGRRKAYALTELLRKYSDADPRIVGLNSLAGIRETVHYKTKYKADGWDMLYGKRYDDAILQGTYRIDMHDKDGGVKFFYLNGKTVYMKGAERNYVFGNWREENGVAIPEAKYYQIPFSVLVQEQYKNIIAAGRMLNADPMAYGALRVMVNLNQLGEAAGVAAVTAIDSCGDVRKISGVDVRKKLISGGSAL
ncbi:MAG: FAD-dependent oxidoreductase [Clostridia bacterium]|nr:FAD-dependent oxidoreductase [Clostridia bacterium]